MTTTIDAAVEVDPIAPEAPEDTKTLSRWQPSAGGWAARAFVLALVLGGIVFATITASNLWATRIALAAIYALIGLSLNIALGYTGQVSLGHHAFVGTAAFVSAYLVSNKDQSFAVGLLAAAATGAAAAAVLGLVALRIRGLYLSLITLTYGFVAVNSIFEIPAFTGGGAGLQAPRPKLFLTNQSYAFLCLGVLAIAIFIDWRMIKSKAGRAILSLKHSEPVAASYAINVTAYKIFAFTLSGALAGVAGSLFAHRVGAVVSTDFEFRIALLWVLMVVVGGLGNRTGVVIGSAFFALFPFLLELWTSLEEFLVRNFGVGTSSLVLVIGPALALLTIIAFPGGIAEQISPITRWLAGNRFTMHPEGHGKKPKKEGRGRLAGLLGKSGRTTTASGSPAAEDLPAAPQSDASNDGDEPQPFAAPKELAPGDKTGKVP